MAQVCLNQEGIDLIKSFEGVHDGDRSTPELEPQRDCVGIWTLGYGSIYGLDGKRVTADHPAISEAEAEMLMRRDLRAAGEAVSRLIRVPLNENEFSALVSFTYNVGSANLQRSTLRQKLNRGDYGGAANELPKWRRAGGRVLAGLVRRRAAERELFLS